MVNFASVLAEYFMNYVVTKGIELLEGHAMPNHVHVCLGFPPKFSISMTVGYIKGKSAI